MRHTMMLVMTGLAVVACGDTDVANRGGELAPGEEIEDMGLERDVEAVGLDTIPWFTEGRTVEFNNRTWILAGEPVYDPAVEYAGEFEGTPLYAEVGVASPGELFIPVGDDYWQMLEATTAPPASAADTVDTEAR